MSQQLQSHSTIILWEFHGPKDVIFEGRQRPLICVETSQNRHFMTKLLKKKTNLKKMLKMRRAYASRTIQEVKEILMRISMEVWSPFLGGHLERL